jgi:hypothetical protein
MKQIQVFKVPGRSEHANNFVCEHTMALLRQAADYEYEVLLLDIQLPPNGKGFRLVELCADCRKKYDKEGGYELVGGLDPNLFALPNLPL